LTPRSRAARGRDIGGTLDMAQYMAAVSAAVEAGREPELPPGLSAATLRAIDDGLARLHAEERELPPAG